MRTTRKTRRMLFVALAAAGASFAMTPDYTLPPITYPTHEEVRLRVRQKGNRLMRLTNVPDGDATLVCTEWNCPTSIVVDATRYLVTTNWWPGEISYGIALANDPTNEVSRGEIVMTENGKDARLSAFTSMSYTSMRLDMYAHGVRIHPLDPATNAMWITSVRGEPWYGWQDLVYKNLHLRYTVSIPTPTGTITNVLPFMVELINAGLPEGSPDRIVLP